MGAPKMEKEINSDLEYVACNLCQTNNTETVYTVNETIYDEKRFFTVVRCKKCGLVYTNPRPHGTLLQNYYEENDYYSYNELNLLKYGKKSWIDQTRFSLLQEVIHQSYGGNNRKGNSSWWKKPLLPLAKRRFGSAPKGLRRGKILDVGCGDGLFLHLVQEEGWEAHGLELGEEAVENAARHGLKVHQGNLTDQIFEEETFDVIRLWSVLEHLPNPCEAIREIYRILKPNGFLIIQVPNFKGLASKMLKAKWSGLDLPLHLFHFSPETLKKVLELNNFEVMKVMQNSVGTLTASVGLSSNVIFRGLNVLFDFILDLCQQGDCFSVFTRKRTK